MAGPLAGPGVQLQIPQNLYPSELSNAPYDYPTNQVCLAAGDAVPIPRGDWLISLGSYCVLQYDDPLTPAGVFTIIASAAWDSGLIYVQSDGFNYRIANMTGCPVGGMVLAYGSGYVQASTSVSIAAGGGSSTWAPIVGGQLAGSATSNGAGYGVAPIVMIPAPPGPAVNSNGIGGIQASGYCQISSGTISSFSFTNPGAGYPSGTTYTLQCLPNPTDPNINTGITLGTVVFSVVGSGSLTGVLCTNPGSPLSTPNNITLSVSGAGTNATVAPIMMQTVVNASIVGTATLGSTGTILLTSAGGYPQAAAALTPVTGTVTNSPQYLVAGSVNTGALNLGLWARPRPLQALLSNGTLAAGAAGAIIYDGGLFYSPPTPVIANGGILGAAASTIVGTATLSLIMGSRPDIVVMQPFRN